MDRGTVGSTQSGRLLVEVRQEGSSAVVTPAGELDHHTADLLRVPLEECLAKGRSRLVVDCSRLEFCDSTGLNVLLGARLKAEAAGGGVHLAAMRPVVARVFEITGAGAVFGVYDTLEAALAGGRGDAGDAGGTSDTSDTGGETADGDRSGEGGTAPGPGASG
jgi:anti-anti-sigma factor